MTSAPVPGPDQDVPWSSVPVDKRLGHLKHMVVDRDIEPDIHGVFDAVRQARLSANEPSNVLIVGATGVGKSDILKRYLANNQEYRLPDGRIKRPVFLVEIRNQSTPMSTAKHMLQLLGLEHPKFLSGSVPELTARVKHQMIAQQVELTILDGFNNTLSDEGRNRSSRVAEWVKDLCKSKTRSAGHPDGLPGEIIPFAVVGTDKTKRIVDPVDNSELSILTPYRYEIDRYRYATSEQVREFRGFLDDLDQELPFDEFSNLGRVDEAGLCPLADKIHAATYGILRQVGYLVREAARIAIVGGKNRIVEEHLYQSVQSQQGLLQSMLLCADTEKPDRRKPFVVVNPFEPPTQAAVKRSNVKRGFQVAA